MSNNDELAIRLHHAVLPATLKGRVCKPAIGIQNKAFKYVPAIQTNLTETFRRAREQIQALKTV